MIFRINMTKAAERVVHFVLLPRHGVEQTHTPKAFANVSPGLERSDNPGNVIRICFNPERVRLGNNPFRVYGFFVCSIPGLERSAPTLGSN